MRDIILVGIFLISLGMNLWQLGKAMVRKYGYRLKGERWHSTVLISDLRGFSDLFQKYSPEEIVKTINEYFGEMIEIVIAHGGTVDKFMGDSILAVFGVPRPLVESEKMAVTCAVKMQICLKDLNEKRTAKGLYPLDMGIGIAAGDVIVGNIGSKKRMEYTIIGNAVNTAYRLQGLAGSGKIMITNRVLDKVIDLVQFERLPAQVIKGNSYPIEIIEVIGMK
jgi:adenylate cyclase